MFGSPSVLERITIHGTFITTSVCIRFVSIVKNLGFRLDSGLTFSQQVKNLKQSCFHKLRNIAKMKKYLSCSQMSTLTQALIISSLDYCNALYFGVEGSVINQLQAIQNRACRVIFGLKKRESTTPYLKKLHWLRIQERIEFKALMLVFKCLNGLAPVYLSELFRYNFISGSRAPSLQTSITKSAKGTRAFQNYAARLWNDLPCAIKQSTSLGEFKSRLKTHLFLRSYNEYIE